MTIDKIIAGLQIIAAHAKTPNEAYCVSAEHDEIWASNKHVTPDSDDGKKMAAAGWHWDADSEAWKAYT